MFAYGSMTDHTTDIGWVADSFRFSWHFRHARDMAPTVNYPVGYLVPKMEAL